MTVCISVFCGDLHFTLFRKNCWRANLGKLSSFIYISLLIHIRFLTDWIHLDLLFQNASESEGEASVFIWTAFQFVLILFFGELLFVDVLGHIEMDLACLFGAFFAGEDDEKLCLHVGTITIFSWKTLVLLL